MRDRYLIAACLTILTIGMVTVAFPQGASSLLVVVSLSTVALLVFRRHSNEKEFLTTIFLGALLVRLAFGVLVHVYGWRDFFGPDALTYDEKGFLLMQYWRGATSGLDWESQKFWVTTGPGWGMSYIVAGLYTLVGRNILAGQSFCAVLGAATAPMVYFCSVKMFSNKNAAKLAAIAIAFFPSFIIWSSQMMKDGLIIFLLVLAMTMVLQLQEKISYAALLLLVLAMLGIFSLRFYIFYMVAIAVGGSFIIGLSSSVQSMVRRTLVLIIVGLSLTYLGVIRNASMDFERYGDLSRIQLSREDLAMSADSGFGGDVDVSTTSGAITALPVGFVYLMFAPFPWTVTNFRQAITLPEVLLWWGLIPLMVSGLWYAVKFQLRSSLPVLIFSLMLTIAYSIFQGNVGTAYRQRTQIQVFLFIFIAVGWTLMKEKREDRNDARGPTKGRSTGGLGRISCLTHVWNSRVCR